MQSVATTAKTAMMAVVSAIQVMKRSGFVSAVGVVPPRKEIRIKTRAFFT